MMFNDSGDTEIVPQTLFYKVEALLRTTYTKRGEGRRKFK